jgi:hypothetical protein
MVCSGTALLFTFYRTFGTFCSGQIYMTFFFVPPRKLHAERLHSGAINSFLNVAPDDHLMSVFSAACVVFCKDEKKKT